MLSWKSVTGLLVGLVFLFLLVFIDWRSLIQQKKLKLKFNIWK
jgi:hypothetical protein